PLLGVGVRGQEREVAVAQGDHAGGAVGGVVAPGDGGGEVTGRSRQIGIVEGGDGNRADPLGGQERDAQARQRGVGGRQGGGASGDGDVAGVLHDQHGEGEGPLLGQGVVGEEREVALARRDAAAGAARRRGGAPVAPGDGGGEVAGLGGAGDVVEGGDGH